MTGSAGLLGRREAMAVGGQNRPDPNAGDETAKVRGEADLRGPKVERRLYSDDGDDGSQLPAGQGRLPMAQEQTGRHADYSHDATGSTDKRIGIRWAQHPQ